MTNKYWENESVHKWILFTFVFAVIVVFFTTIHPVTIISGDEWINLSSGRQAFPEWGGFNPIKVVPEVIFPLFGNISSSILMPLGLDFLAAIAYLTALLIAILVVVFLYQFYAFMRERFEFSPYTSTILTLFYLLCLFGLFRTLNNNNSPYLLWEHNLTCYYHYIVPALINGSLAIFFLRRTEELKNILKSEPVISGVIILTIYLCVFSNIFASVFLAVICGLVILFDFIHRRFNILDTLKNFPFHLITLIMWALSAIYEMNGGRAGRMAKDHLDISGTINVLSSLVSLIDNTFFIVLAIGIVCGILFLATHSSSINKSTLRYGFWITLLACLITTIALILICAKASPNYAARPVAMWGIFMYLIIASSIGIGLIVERWKTVTYIAPIVLFCLLNKTTDQKNSLRESHNGNVPYSVAYAIGQNIISQVQNAVDANEKTMILYVPKGDNHDNWPFPITRGKAISETLKSNGLIHRNIEIKIQPDITLNHKYGMPY